MLDQLQKYIYILIDRKLETEILDKKIYHPSLIRSHSLEVRKI